MAAMYHLRENLNSKENGKKQPLHSMIDDR